MSNERTVEINTSDWKCLVVSSDCRGSIENRIFQEEVQRMGMGHLAIRLITPEENAKFLYDYHLSDSVGNHREGYCMQLTISPNGIEDHTSGYTDWTQMTIGDYMLMRYDNMNYYEIFRSRVRRELRLINSGFVDFKDQLSKVVSYAVSPVIYALKFFSKKPKG